MNTRSLPPLTLTLAALLLLLPACGSAPAAGTPGDGDGDGDSGDGDGDTGDGDTGDGDTGDGDGDTGDGDTGDGDTGDGDTGDGDTGDGDGDTGDGDGDTVQEPEDGEVVLPMVVDKYFVVSGYSGDGESGKVKGTTSCPQRAGDERGDCHKFVWSPSNNGWASVFWQHPHDNWGTTGKPGRKIPAGAKEISFYAWGKNGGESISFGAGLSGQDSFTIMSPPFTLTSEPKKYSLSLAGVDYGADTISAFMWSANQGVEGSNVEFYVDDITWVTDATVGPSPEWPEGPDANGVSVRVRNLCSFPLWVDGGGAGATLNRVRVNAGDIHNYDVPKVWESARVNAFKNEGDPEPIEKAELTFYNADGKSFVSYNVTYVDWVGLPLEITALGGECNAASHTTGCFAREAELSSACPESFLRSGDRCMAPRSYCLNAANQSHPYCHALDSAIQNCGAGCPKGSTPEAYACSGPYAEEPRWCAAINRGMTSAPDDPDQTHYYKNPPYNTYAKWVHEVCPGIYAFSYDDWKSHGGYRACAGGQEVRITFCPGG